MNQKKKTVGQLAYDLLKKADDKHTIGEQTKEQLSEFDQELFKCFDTNKNRYTKVFYLVVLTRSDKHLTNVLRHTFFTRNSAPTPGYDQAVYQCHKDWPEPKFMWVIPNKDYCDYMINNKDLIHPNEYLLLQYVIDFYDGVLLKLVKKLNNETENTGQLILEKN